MSALEALGVHRDGMEGGLMPEKMLAWGYSPVKRALVLRREDDASKTTVKP